MKNFLTDLRAIVLIVLGVVLVLIARAFMNMQGEAVLLGIFLVPLIVYIGISARNFEIGFGEWKAKVGQAADETVNPELGQIGPSLADMVEVGQQGIAALERMLQTYRLNEAKPIVMTIILGRGDYPRIETLGFVKDLLLYRSFKFVVFVEKDGQVKGYMPSWAIKEVLSKPELGEEFISVINTRERLYELYDYPNVIKETINIKGSNADALRQIVQLNLDALVVVDEKNRLAGVVERERLLSKMILALANK